MCQKQCRDENGFKCHQTSEGHLRQMRIFAENPETIMQQVNAWTRESLKGYVIQVVTLFSGLASRILNEHRLSVRKGFHPHPTSTVQYSTQYK